MQKRVWAVLLILLLFSQLLLANDLSNQFEVDEKVKPTNEKITLFDDYRITQPIKGALTWGSVGLMAGLIIDLQPYLEHNSVRVLYSTKMLKIGVGSGIVIGLYKGFKAHNKRVADPDYRIAKNRYGYEIVHGRGPLEEYSTSPGQQNGFGVVANFEYKLIDELKIRVLYKEWAVFMLTDSPTEIKYNVQAMDYFRKDKIFSPYYGAGIGLSNGEFQVYNFADYSVDNKTGFFPFMHTLAGIRMNLFDFFYCNLEFDYELSSFYHEVNKHYNYSHKQNVMTSFVLGVNFF